MIKRIVKLLISLLVMIWDELVSSSHQLFGVTNTNYTVVLYYHAVPAEQASQFARQMNVVKRYTSPIALHALDGRTAASGGCHICVTFDDGYVSFVKNALPEIVLRQVPVTLFVTTGSIGTRPRWISDSKHRFANEEVIDAAEIKRLSRMPLITIGSHCTSHTRLTELNFEMIKEELSKSKNTLEDLTGKSVDFVSFPHGCFNENVLSLCIKSGYSRVFSIEPVYYPLNVDSYVVGRVEVDTTDWMLEFYLKLRGSYRWLAKLSKNKSPNMNIRQAYK